MTVSAKNEFSTHDGAGDDTFVSVDTQSATTQTLTSGDSLVGGAGTDTLTITNTVAGAIDTPVTTLIENLVIRSLNNDNTTETFAMTSLQTPMRCTIK